MINVWTLTFLPNMNDVLAKKRSRVQLYANTEWDYGVTIAQQLKNWLQVKTQDEDCSEINLDHPTISCLLNLWLFWFSSTSPLIALYTPRCWANTSQNQCIVNISLQVIMRWRTLNSMVNKFHESSDNNEEQIQFMEFLANWNNLESINQDFSLNPVKY